MRRLISLAIVLLAAACGSSTSPVSGGPPGSSNQVHVGNLFFQSGRNGTQNPAVDTIAVGDSITWKWVSAGGHSLQSTGDANHSFLNSAVLTTSGSAYTVVIRKAGTFPYQCGVHGPSMSGVIVVQ